MDPKEEALRLIAMALAEPGEVISVERVGLAFPSTYTNELTVLQIEYEPVNKDDGSVAYFDQKPSPDCFPLALVSGKAMMKLRLLLRRVS